MLTGSRAPAGKIRPRLGQPVRRANLVEPSRHFVSRQVVLRQEILVDGCEIERPIVDISFKSGMPKCSEPVVYVPHFRRPVLLIVADYPAIDAVHVTAVPAIVVPGYCHQARLSTEHEALLDGLIVTFQVRVSIEYKERVGQRG